jgi:hypothetical protein
MTYFALAKATLILLSESRKPTFPPLLHLTVKNIIMSFSPP